MAHIKSEQMYQALLKRIDELLNMTSDNDSMDDPRMLELDIISDLIVEYEDIHYPIGKEKQASLGWFFFKSHHPKINFLRIFALQ